MTRTRTKVTKDINGQELPTTATEMHLGLLTRAVDREIFATEWRNRYTRDALAKEHGISNHDVDLLVAYWALPPRIRPYNSGSKGVPIDQLAERLFELVEPRIQDLVDAAVAKALS